jgi:peptide/nickel transport system permease protein
MLQYIVRRFLQMIPILVLVSLLTFALVRFAGPDPTFYMIEMNPNIKPEDIEREQVRLGLRDEQGNVPPLTTQYFYWLVGVLQGDFGWSTFYSDKSAMEVLFLFLPNSLILMGTSLAISMAIALPIGIRSAVKQYSRYDYTFTTLSFLGMSVPIFWLALIGLIVFHLLPMRLFGFPLFPAGDLASFGRPWANTFYDRLWHLALPALVLSVANMASWTRYMRSSLLEVIRSDYIRTAWAKGLPERTVVRRHALRNALIPMVTVVTLAIPFLFTGTIVVEQVFAYPGLGRAFLRALSVFDFSVVQGAVVFFALITMGFNLLADILYPLIDPRIRYQ